jgi:hypothetical protein
MGFKEAVEQIFLNQLSSEIELNRLLPKANRATQAQLVSDVEQVVKDMFFEYLQEIANTHTF